jgi:hypothetical protein
MQLGEYSRTFSLKVVVNGSYSHLFINIIIVTALVNDKEHRLVVRTLEYNIYFILRVSCS